MIDMILGTAGHIDHGKTSLIRALTGVDTDRLPEEKRRGITIELGFAELVISPFRFGIVDVPGHERFVRQMLAGASGMDLAMLVIAADESVKPQTREHLDILRMLELSGGVIVLTKCDLVAEEWLELVELEVREVVAASPLAEAPIVRVSSTTGAGLDKLRDTLRTAADDARPEARAETASIPFRMPIDRCFSLAGHGTIVTGSVGSGRLQVGDELSVEPSGRKVRVRSMHNHDRPVEELHRGQRAAVNLAGLDHDEIERGHELATPGSLRASRLLAVQMALLDSLARPLKSRSRVRVHLGTAETMGTVHLLGTESCGPGESAFARLLLAEPVSCVWNQRLVLRTESPVRTIGGGRVLSPHPGARFHRKDDVVSMLERLGTGDELERASAAVAMLDGQDWRHEELFRLAGVVDGKATADELTRRGDLAEISISPSQSRLLHRDYLDGVGQRLVAALRRLHDFHPLRTMMERHWLTDAFASVPAPVLNYILDRLQRDGVVRCSERGLGLIERAPRLSKSEERLREQLVERFLQAGMESPSVEQCQAESARNRESIPQLLELSAGDGDLVQIADGYYLHIEVEQNLRQRVADLLNGGRGMTISELREQLETTRKYAVPLFEYLDRQGFTLRRGDQRFLATPVVPNRVSPGADSPGAE